MPERLHGTAITFALRTRVELSAKYTVSVTRYCSPGDTDASAGSSSGVSAAEAEPPGPIGPSARALPRQSPRPVTF